MINPENWDDKAIVALSSGKGPVAISVIRISGFSKLSELSCFFSKDLTSVEPNKMYKSDFIHNENFIDDLCFCFFQGPKSYNGENILELYCHGNDLIVDEIMTSFCSLSQIRLAYPGEFSYRAFKNKKLSLSQVEGLDIFLKSSSSPIKDLGFKALRGELRDEYLRVWNCFLELKSSLEVYINFSEDVGEERSQNLIAEHFKSFSEQISYLNQRCQLNPDTLLSPKIVLSGPVNAGKSSFFNWILGHKRSIVSSEKGTTRDYISEYLNLGKIKFQFIDTAGLRDATNSVEKAGIEMSKELVNSAFFNIFVFDGAHIVSEIDCSDADAIVLSHGDKVLESSKINDLRSFIPMEIPIFMGSFVGPIGAKTQSGPIEPPVNSDSGPIGPAAIFKSGPIEPLNITGPIEPLENLESLIVNKYNDLCNSNPVLIERHVGLIREISKKSLLIQSLVDNFGDAGILAHEIQSLEKELSELVGIVTSTEVLDNIFTNFCIGK